MRKLTEERIKEVVRLKSKSFLEGYYRDEKRNLVLKMKCKCGNLYEVRWSKVNTKKPKVVCNDCSYRARGKKQMITNEEYQERKKALGIKIENIEEYKGRHNKIEHICPSCHGRWSVTPANVLAKASKMCLECSVKNNPQNNKKDDSWYKQKKSELGIKITNTEPYKGSKEKIKHICPSCERGWMIEPNAILSRNSTQCEECSVKNRNYHKLSDRAVERKLKDAGLIWVEGTYCNRRSKLLLKCSCGNTFVKSLSDVEKGYNKCRECAYSISLGEREIARILDSENLKYTHQKSFDELLSPKGWRMYYDFYIPSLNLVIEYDGAHHFKPMYDLFESDHDAEIEFRRVKLYDEIKEDFLKEKGIKLMRFSGKNFKEIEKTIVQYANTEINGKNHPSL